MNTNKKENFASPNVSLRDIMINSAIEGHKERDIQTIDILGTYLQMKSDKDVITIKMVNGIPVGEYRSNAIS